MVKINKYCESLIDTIDLETDPRFVEMEKESMRICSVKLIDYLSNFVQLYSKGIDNVTDEEIIFLNDLSNKLLGRESLGDCSPQIISEALYYIRLFQLEDAHMKALVELIYAYDNDDQLQAIMKLNSLVMMNITCFGAGSTRPLFALSSQDDDNKDAQDLEVAIIYLIRNINNINMSLAQPMLSSPLDILAFPKAQQPGTLEEEPHLGKAKISVRSPGTLEEEPQQQLSLKEDTTEIVSQSKNTFLTIPEMLFMGLITILIMTLPIIHTLI